jgi:hypothetical protein
MRTFASRIAMVLVVGGLIGLSCKETPPANSTPTITALDLPSSVDITNDATFSCTATDADGDPLGYTWTCSSGLLHSKTGSVVEWTAPETSGVATVTVTVVDSSGAADTMSGTVTVNAVTTTIVDWDSTVAGSDAAIWTREIPAGYTVHGSFAADGQDITFLVLDNYNYGRWRNDSSYSAVIKIERSPGSDFNVAAETITSIYSFVLDNTYNVNPDTSVHLLVQRTSP